MSRTVQPANPKLELDASVNLRNKDGLVYDITETPFKAHNAGGAMALMSSGHMAGQDPKPAGSHHAYDVPPGPRRSRQRHRPESTFVPAGKSTVSAERGPDSTVRERRSSSISTAQMRLRRA
jgi:hypothetical protein